LSRTEAASNVAPVITIDGPTASGKGTIAMKVAQALSWRYLDSGALYRLVGLRAVRAGADPVDEPTLVKIAINLSPQFSGNKVFLPVVEAGPEGFEDVSEAIRSEAVGNMASRIAVLPQLRGQLLALQHAFRRPPGLVADGRDMGTVVFPDAMVKVFLTASAASRAQRRHKQLIDKGISANLADLLTDLEARDARDSQRATAPLVPAAGAFVLDSTALSIDQTVTAVLERYQATVLANAGSVAGSDGGVDAV
jgi:CMP/dCMP kinase